MDQMFWDGQKEKWKEKQQEIEEKRNEFLPEHLKRQRIRKEIFSRKPVLVMLERKLMKERRVIWSWRREVEQKPYGSRRFGRITQVLAGRGRRGSCASQSNGCCFDAVMEQLFTLGATHARQQIQALIQRKRRRVERGATAKSSQSPNGCNESFPAGSVFDPARYQDAKGDSGAGGEFNSPRTTRRQQRMKFCEREWKERGDWREKKGRNKQGKDPRTFEEENSQEKDPSTIEGRSHQVEKWPVQEKRKEEKEEEEGEV